MGFQIFAGSASKKLSSRVSEILGRDLGRVQLTTFSDGEIRVRFDETVRGKDIFIIQSTSNPADRNLMELMIMTDALRRASSKSVTAIIPYFGYSRQDRKAEPRVAITAKLVANLLTTAGIDRVVTMNLHAGQIQGFFDIPVDNLYSSPIIIPHLRNNGYGGEDCVVVSPDAGGTIVARAYAKILKSSLAMIDKRRSEPGVIESMRVVGDVKGKRAILIDDMIDTAGTLVSAADALMANGAKEVIAVATHGIFSGPAIERLNNSCITKVYVTDTIDNSNNMGMLDKIDSCSVAEIIAVAIKNIDNHTSLHNLFPISE